MNRVIMNRVLGLLMISLALASQPAWAEQALQVEDAWVREGPPNAQVLGGFMHLRNPGTKTVEITTVTSPSFERVEMHRSVTENGMAKMIAQDSLAVPAGGELRLAPGGYHLMLFAPKQAVRAGQQIQLTLQTADGAQIAVEAQVRTGMGGMNGGHHHH